MSRLPGKRARPVLRGPRRSNAPGLLDGDLLTPRGCPLLWPLSWRLEMPLIDIDTNSWRETKVIAPALAVAVALLGWIRL